jgi:septal ring factor EnvC (AmiA/AmiB activator)
LNPAIKKAFVGDYERATLAFKYIAAMRFLLESNFEKTIKESNEGIKEFQTKNTGLQSQIATNNIELKTVYDKIFEIEKELKQLQSDKYVINSKNKNLQEKINGNNQNQKKIDTELKIQEESYLNFKSTLSK